MTSADREPISRPVSAGVVSALVGFTGAFVVVLSGLAGVGADRDEAASGLLAVSVTMGLACILLAVSTRMPITVAWSTPGAALLATAGAATVVGGAGGVGGSGADAGGWPVAIGAFLLTGLLIVATGAVPALGALIARIPASVAQAMLAGVVFQLCLGPITGLARNPIEVAPVVVVWLLALRLLPRWASPLAFVTAAVVIGVHLLITGDTIPAGELAPRIVLTAPEFTVGGVIGIAIPLFLVTMASQNVPGVAIMRGFGYEVPWRRSMLVTGIGTLVGATAGGHAINLAAISAALAAGPDAGEDRSRRWIASVTAGSVLVVLGIASSAFAALVGVAPLGVIPAVAGLALLGTLAGSLRAALDDPGERIPAVVAFATAASGIAIAGVSAAFWALVAGVVVRVVLTSGRRSSAG